MHADRQILGMAGELIPLSILATICEQLLQSKQPRKIRNTAQDHMHIADCPVFGILRHPATMEYCGMPRNCRTTTAWSLMYGENTATEASSDDAHNNACTTYKGESCVRRFDLA